MSYEGWDVAKKLNEWGIAAFVLKYRMPDDNTMVNKEIGPLQDAQRAIQLVRERAAEWNINPQKIGIMGFSAGGHLASTAGTHFEKAVIENKKNISLRPDFMILLYPVISLSDSLGHIGSRDNLLGKKPAAEKIKEYSNELQVQANTPPAFLVHAGDDNAVNVKNSIAFYEAEQSNKLPAELHIYPHGGHGFGMNNKTTKDQWTDRLKNWLSGLGF
jgi:acetyl esterase/lipase